MITDSGVQAIPADVVVEIVSLENGNVQVKYRKFALEAPADAVIQHPLDPAPSNSIPQTEPSFAPITPKKSDRTSRPSDLELNNQLSSAQVERQSLEDRHEAELLRYHQNLNNLKSEFYSNRSEDRRNRSLGKILARGDKSKTTEELEIRLQQAEGYLEKLKERHAGERAPIALRIRELQNQINNNLRQYHRDMSEQLQRTRETTGSNASSPTRAP